jgi:N utilization substance protein B
MNDPGENIHSFRGNIHIYIDFGGQGLYNYIKWTNMRHSRRAKGSYKMTRREAREAVFGLLFETDFHPEDSADNIFSVSTGAREIAEAEDDYIRTAYFGVIEHLADIDKMISEHSHGWKTYRMSGISRSALRLSIWEMLYMNSIPHSVSINEAIELVKKYDDEKARPFVNGVLNAAKDAIEAAANDGGKTEK